MPETSWDLCKMSRDGNQMEGMGQVAGLVGPTVVGKAMAGLHLTLWLMLQRRDTRTGTWAVMGSHPPSWRVSWNRQSSSRADGYWRLSSKLSPGAGRDTPTLWMLSPPAAIKRLHGSCRSGQWPAFLSKESLWCSHEAPIGNATSDLYKKHRKSWLSFLPYLGLDSSSRVSCTVCPPLFQKPLHYPCSQIYSELPAW